MNKYGIEIIECYKTVYSDENALIRERKELSYVSKMGHTHDFYHYSFVLVSKNDCIRIDHRNIPLKSGYIYMVKPGILHAFEKNCSSSLEIIELKFKITDEEIKNISSSLPNFLYAPEVLPILSEIIDECASSAFNDGLAFLKINELLIKLRRMAREKRPIDSPDEYRILSVKNKYSALIDYINQNYCKKLTVSDLANFIHMEKVYFCKQFKKNFDLTPMNYVNLVRIYHSLNLLEYTELSIDKISEEVGFGCQNSYNKAFKKSYNLTPKQYRTKIRKELSLKYAEIHGKTNLYTLQN